MLLEFIAYTKLFILLVLILIVMEDALRVGWKYEITKQWNVLILIVMEDALRDFTYLLEVNV